MGIESWRHRPFELSHGAHFTVLASECFIIMGANRIMEAMDWGDASDFVRFGAVGQDQVDDCAFYILIAPQNVVGTTIMDTLTQMVNQGHPSLPCTPMLTVFSIGCVQDSGAGIIWSPTSRRSQRSSKAMRAVQMERAELEGKAVVLVNPKLEDMPTHSGIMGVRCAPAPVS